MAKITNMIMGIVLIGLVSSGFFYFYQGGVEQYTLSDYNESVVNELKTTSLGVSNTVNQTQESLLKLKGNPNFFDVIGTFFSSAYSSLKTILGSFITITGLIDIGISNIPIGSAYAYDLKNGLLTLVMLLIIASLFRAVFKVDP